MTLLLPDALRFNFFTNEFRGQEILREAERKLVNRWSSKRIAHFSTGRFCARKAISLLGEPEPDILIGLNREPVWPSGLVGSISHTDTLCGAVVSESSRLRAVGLDIESTGKIEPEMWNLIYLPSEQEFLKSLPETEQAYYTTLLFSMKESFYKLQFPLTKTFLEFTDVELIPNNSQFALKVIRDFPEKKALPEITPINFLKEGDQLITYCYLE